MSRKNSTQDQRVGADTDTRATFSQELENAEQQADNLGPVPPAGFRSRAIADAYATPGRVGTGEKPKWNAAIVTSWDEQHPQGDDPEKDNIGEDVDVDGDEELGDPVPEVDAVRPIDEPKRRTPVARVGEDGRPVAAKRSGARTLSADKVIEVEKARDEAQEANDPEDALDSAYARGE